MSMLRDVCCRAAVALSCAAGVVLLASQPSAAQSVAQFYKGRTISLLVGVAPGGINDISARLVARHLGKFIPGNPSIVVQNLPGAGGLAMANRMYAVAEHDGSVIAGMERATPQQAIMGNAKVQFDPLKFTWLGSLSSYGHDAYLLAVNASFPAKTVADLQKPGGKPAHLGGGNAASSNLIFATIAKTVLGLNVEPVRGYPGAAPLFLAMQRGEIDGQVVGFSALKTAHSTLWESKGVRALVQFGRTTRLDELADVPTGRELAKSDADKALLDFAELPFFMALPYVAPPNVPADRAEALQTAFMAMVKDKDFLEDAKKLRLDISPISGKFVQSLLTRSAATPKDVIARYNALVAAPKK